MSSNPEVRDSIALLRTNSEAVGADLRRAFDLSGCTLRIPSGGLVVLKPNLVTDKPDYISRGANTSVAVLESILALLSDHRCRVLIAESETGTAVKGRRLERTWELMGLPDLADRYGATLVNLTEEPTTLTQLEASRPLELPLPSVLFECDLLIDIPKIKTHKYAGLTCCMKNLFGLIPEPRRIIHHGRLHEIIAGLAKLLQPSMICVVDGLVGMEGNGPLYGKPVDLNLLLVGANAWEIDRAVCELIAIDPGSIPYLRVGERIGLAESETPVIVGETLTGCRRPFEPVPFNPYRLFEKKLMESPLVHLVTAEWFQRHVTRHAAWATQWARGGGYSWYLDEDRPGSDKPQ